MLSSRNSPRRFCKGAGDEAATVGISGKRFAVACLHLPRRIGSRFGKEEHEGFALHAHAIGLSAIEHQLLVTRDAIGTALGPVFGGAFGQPFEREIGFVRAAFESRGASVENREGGKVRGAEAHPPALARLPDIGLIEADRELHEPVYPNRPRARQFWLK